MMFYRLRDYTTPLTYQQARIILWGGVVAFVPTGIWFVSQLFLPIPFIPVLFLPFLLIFPVVLGICIIRLRLWDIDIIINRTLVYGSLSNTLIFVYFTSVIFLENLLVVLTGQGTELSIVISTLLIAGLFIPLRNSIQRDIDRKFYRHNYNAQKMQEEYGETLR